MVYDVLNYGQKTYNIIQYCSTVYRDQEGLVFHRSPLNYFVTSRQDWLGIAKPKNIFRSTYNPSTKLI